MFVGHFGLGLAGKAVAPRASLGTWFLSVQFLDLLWPIFLLLGWEHVRIAPGNTRFTPLDFYDYPISHSMVGALGWAVLFAVVYFARRRDARTAALLGLGVFSHWLLDAAVHGPDLPIFPGGPKVGLGLWDYPVTTLVVEIPIYVAGIAMYLGTTRPRDVVGWKALWALVALLMLIYLSPAPPPNVTVLAWIGMAQWLIVAWAYWVDRHREPREAEAFAVGDRREVRAER